MPINCPLHFDGSCENCPKRSGDKCFWFFPSKPLREILTQEERIDELENHLARYEDMVVSLVPSRVLAQIRKEFNQLKGEFISLTNKYNEHIDKSKKKKKPRAKSKTVDV